MQLVTSLDGILSPKPAELVTLPSYMECHAHNYTQIVISLKGQAEFEVNGCGNLLGPGQGCVVASGLRHSFGCVIGQSDILVLNMLLASLDDPLMLLQLNELNPSDVYFQLDHQIQKLIQTLVAEMHASPDDLLLSRACNTAVMALLHRHISSLSMVRKESRFDLGVIDRYIERHITHKISIGQLASCVFLGESQFHRLFKAQLGITPHQYVLGKRIDIAKRLIENSQLKLGQVAELSGFSGQSTFSHAFSRLQGISPSQYKKQFC